MIIIIGLSSLPYLHELIILKDGTLPTWIPDWNLRNILADENGKVFKYSSYRKFLYALFINLFILSGWLGWFKRRTGKHYRYAILMPLLSSIYQLIIILTSNRSAWFNSPDIKLVVSLGIGLGVGYWYFKKTKTKLTTKLILIWAAFYFISTLPYLHDIITLRNGEVRNWIPILGIENVLTDSEGYILGFTFYRVFVFAFMTHLFAQIGWAGWYFDSYYRINRPFLLVPVIFSLYELTIITLNISETAFNKPDWKLYATILLAIVWGINVYFNDKKRRSISKKYKAVNHINNNYK